jgi:hypothetical protein
MVSNRVMNLALTTAMYTDGWDYDPWYNESSFSSAVKQLRKVVREVYPKAKVKHGVYRTAVVLKDWVLKVSHCRQSNALLNEARFIASMRSTPKFRKHFPKTFVVRFGKGHAVVIQERIVVMPDSKLSFRYLGAVEDFAAQFGITDMHEENFGWAGPTGKEYPVFVDVDSRRELPAWATKPLPWDRFRWMSDRD